MRGGEFSETEETAQHARGAGFFIGEENRGNAENLGQEE